jgi:GDP-L-fucose synthase
MMAIPAPIFLTGATGMAGHNVLDLARERGFDVVAPRHSELDLLDSQAVATFLRKVRPGVVVHAAGRVGGIEANMREPVRFLTENYEMGKNIVLGAREAGVRRLINLGSSCIYPKDSPHLLREEDILSGPLEPTNEAYAIAKSAVLRLCSYISAETPEFQYKTLIPCNLYGRYDNFDPKRSHLAAAVIHKLHRAKIEALDTVDIWGDGTARREFLYAGDLADAILTAIERFDSLPYVLNIGAGIDHTVNEYYAAAAEVVGFTGSFEHDKSKPVGMKRKLMDVSRATAWSWTAKTSLKNGLAEAYAFYKTALPPTG